MGFVLVLLGGTAAAFAITERLKLEKTPITSPDITKWYSWRSDRQAEVAFRLRKADTITVDIVRGETVVRTLATDVRHKKGEVSFKWDGRDQTGEPVPEGVYKARVHLARAHRTIVIPNPIHIDLDVPKVALGTVRPRVISPDHDGRGEYIRVHFRADEPSRVLLYINGQRAGKGQLERRGGKINWFGALAGRTLRAGVYTLTVRAEDRAGNISPASRGVQVRIRYVTLPKVVHARAGKRFRVRVDTDAARVVWRLAGLTHRAAAPALRLKAPKQPGRYTLYVTVNGHSAAAAVVVRPSP
jgi:FlgD Ig-like domain